MKTASKTFHSLSLQIPDQRAPDSRSFDTSPRAVRRWLESLPTGSRSESIKRIFGMLQEVNSLDIPLDDRFKLLEMLNSPVHTLLSAIGRHCAEEGFPLSDKARLVAQVSSQLQAEMIIGYRIILSAEASAGWLFRKINDDIWITSLHRLFHYFTGIVNNFRVLSVPYSVGIWQEIHSLYRKVQDAGRANEMVSPIDNNNQQRSIDEEYKRLLLIALLSPRSFRQGQMAELSASMDEWLDLVHVQPPCKPMPRNNQGICVRAHGDEPPRLVTAQCTQGCEHSLNGVELNTQELLKQLNGYLDSADGEAVTINNGATVSTDTLRILRDRISSLNTAREERLPSSHDFDLIIGFRQVYHLLRDVTDSLGVHAGVAQHDVVDEEEIEEIELSDAVPGIWQAQRENEEDVWDMVYTRRQSNRKSWISTTVKPTLSIFDAKSLNESDGGYCLTTTLPRDRGLKVGELLAMHREGDHRLHIGIIRWIEGAEEGNVTVGTQTVAADPEPLDIVIIDSDNHISEPLHSIHAVDERGMALLMMPYLPEMRNKKLAIEQEGVHLPIDLGEREYFTPLFEVFEYSLHKKKGARRDQKTERSEKEQDIWSLLE